MAMFENISEFFKRFMQSDKKELLAENPTSQSKDTAKDRLHIVLMQDRANVSADFLELMKEEIIEVIKKYIVVDESKIDVRLTNEENEDGSLGAPLLHANIPILNVRNDLKGTYMNGGPSDKIEGQQEIDLEENKEENSEKPQETAPEAVTDTGTEKKTETVETAETTATTDATDVTENTETPETTNSENEPPKEEIHVENAENVVTLSDSLNEEITESVTEGIANSAEEDQDDGEENYDEIDDEDDDDVTFDDLLKAAEEEEKRLKEAEEQKENRDRTNDFRDRKKTVQKKKKASRINKNK